VCSGAAESLAPPYEDKFSHRIKIQSKDDSDSDSVSDEGGQEYALAHQALGTIHFGLPPWVKRLPLLLRVPCRMPCRQLIVKERIQLVLNFTLCLIDGTLTTLACNRDFMKRSYLMDQENVVSIHNGILCSHEEERNVIICW
jgi:hypothetical protein